MEKRSMRKLGIQTSLLGYGCMRLPENNGEIDMAKTQELIDYAYGHGVNYYDTAYVYHGGKSEGAMGKALSKYPRETYFVADKMPVWEVKTEADLERIFNEQLERLGTEYIDFYLLHSLGTGNFATVKQFDMISFCEKKKAEGKIRYIGYSFHDKPEVFREIINYYNWDFCQMQLNYVDWEGQSAKELYAMAEERDIPVVIMEPVRGGDLANLMPEMENVFRAADPEKSSASWALRYVGTLPQVKVILSGMTTIDQVVDNVATFSDFKPFEKNDYEVVDKALAELSKVPQIGCTGCRYCMPCPAEVGIPNNFHLYNEYQKFHNKGSADWQMSNMEGGLADSCVECGACLEKCPQHIDIPEQLKKVAALEQSLR